MALDWTGERFIPGLNGDIAFEHLHRYALAAAIVRGKSCLDIASGEGYGTRLLASVASQATGVDVDEAAVDHARGRYSAPNLEFLRGDCCAIPCPDAQFDVVISFETIEHLADHDRAYAEFKRVLKPGGSLLISCPEKKTYGAHNNPFHVRELTFAEFIDLNSRYFRNTSFMQQKMVHGSAIWPARPADGGCSCFTAHGGSHGINLSPTMSEGMFNIAVCSDGPLPAPTASIFEGQGIQTTLQLVAAELQSRLASHTDNSIAARR